MKMKYEVKMENNEISPDIIIKNEYLLLCINSRSKKIKET